MGLAIVRDPSDVTKEFPQGDIHINTYHMMSVNLGKCLIAPTIIDLPSITEHPGTCRQGRQGHENVISRISCPIACYRKCSRLPAQIGYCPNFMGEDLEVCGVRCCGWGSNTKKKWVVSSALRPMGTWLKKARGHLCMQSKHGGMFFLRSLSLSLVQRPTRLQPWEERDLLFTTANVPRCTFFCTPFLDESENNKFLIPARFFLQCLFVWDRFAITRFVLHKTWGRQGKRKRKRSIRHKASPAHQSVKTCCRERERWKESHGQKVCCQQGKQHAIRRARKGGKELVYPYPLGVSCSCFPPMHNWTNPLSPLLSHASGALCPLSILLYAHFQCANRRGWECRRSIMKRKFSCSWKETEECAMCKCANVKMCIKRGNGGRGTGRGGIEWPLTLSHTLTLLTVIPPLSLLLQTNKYFGRPSSAHKTNGAS